MRLLGGLLLAGCGSAGAGADAGTTVTVPLADVLPGVFVVKGVVVVAKDAGGYYAMSAICTHEECVLAQRSDNTCLAPCVLACPCHGSRYDADGHVLVGPATDDLVHYAVTVTADALVVDRSTIVPADWRA